MINSFIITLTNSSTQPTISGSTAGDIYWPANVKLKQRSSAEDRDYQTLFAGTATSEDRLIASIQYIWLIRASICSDYELLADPRITYNDDQLRGQLAAVSSNNLHRVQASLALLNQLDGSYLSADLAIIRAKAISPLDKLAAIVAHLGQA